ncbi:ABC transporter permease [Providencia hangzhouensis]|uniref:Ribose ABC transporter permease n=1 Tax=Providencia rettgeri TaxID=587 RepID=A0AAJ4TJ04_PRORE|nr:MULTISPECIES: ribose ABC transporter permease [Providencia]MBJ9972585.1 ribose ABC transporter permease [Providencia rettgeri]MCB6145520.1 ribose ABC transporter permease [Providencia rettgeri]MCF8964634.1 Ribose import permease protein RbsC [Providencia rettgeri]QWQ17709.1 ribose ABC transporter permease [Providencia rettgeri]QWQ21543.1 ribose ABC transporter permease [Providencia rettgeri]
MSNQRAIPLTKNKFSFSKLTKIPAFLPFVGLILLFVCMSIFNEHFLTVNNLSTIARQVSINAIIAIGMTFAILTGGIDLSVGAVMALSGTLMAGLMKYYGMDPYAAIAFGLLSGVAFGFINGILAAYGKMPPIIVTLGAMIIAKGLALIYTGGYPVSGLPQEFAFWGREELMGIQVPILLMLGLYLIFYVVLNHVSFGRYIYAIGGNEEAARLSGIRVERYKMLVYVISGFTAAFAGLIFTSRVMSGQPNAGVGFELDAIAAVVLGGASIAGGRGMIIGTLIGAMILGVLNNGLNLLGISPYVQYIVKGLIIWGATLISSMKR